MALAPAVQHARKRSQRITWEDEDGNPIDGTGSTITGIIERNGVQSAITGTLVWATAASGIYDWSYSVADIAEHGTFFVQFRAKYASDGKSEISYRTQWRVLPAFDFELVSASVSPSGSSSPSASPSPSS